MQTERRAGQSARILVALLMMAVLLRLLDIGSFPEIAADEGLWTNSSKNYLFFDDWFMDGRTHLLLSPVFHVLSLPLFALLGPGIESARYLSAFAGIVSTVLLYFLVRRISGSELTALLSAALFSFDQFTVVLSRRAMIEPLQLMWLLACGLALLRGGRLAPVLGGVLFALALLTKINAIFMAAVFPLFLVPWGEGRIPIRPVVMRSLVFLGTTALIVGATYGLLYLAYPARFMSAFVFELDGKHFEELSRPLFRVGRFGLDPTQAGRTVLELFRESPFLMVLATIGAAISWALRPRGYAVFGVWLVIGAVFVLGQMFQPLRYFYLVAPAFAYFAAQPLVALRQSAEAKAGQASRLAIAVVLLFSIAYVGMNWVANRGEKLAVVRAWAAQNLQPGDKVLAAGYLCTDLPARAYAHYHLARTPAELQQTIKRLGINFVIADRDEWSPQLRSFLDQSYGVAAEFRFGKVYRINGSEKTSSFR